jgi:hypothetical protein
MMQARVEGYRERPWLAFVPFTSVLPGDQRALAERGGCESKQEAEMADCQAVVREAGEATVIDERQWESLRHQSKRLTRMEREAAEMAKGCAAADGAEEGPQDLFSQEPVGGSSSEEDSDTEAMKLLGGRDYKWEGRHKVRGACS